MLSESKWVPESMNERLGGIVEIRARIGFVHGPLCAQASSTIRERGQKAVGGDVVGRNGLCLLRGNYYRK